MISLALHITFPFQRFCDKLPGDYEEKRVSLLRACCALKKEIYDPIQVKDLMVPRKKMCMRDHTTHRYLRGRGPVPMQRPWDVVSLPHLCQIWSHSGVPSLAQSVLSSAFRFSRTDPLPHKYRFLSSAAIVFVCLF